MLKKLIAIILLSALLSGCGYTWAEIVCPEGKGTTRSAMDCYYEIERDLVWTYAK